MVYSKFMTIRRLVPLTFTVYGHHKVIWKMLIRMPSLVEKSERLSKLEGLKGPFLKL